jgi:uncharacterized phage protein (TIGR02220 family)
MFPDIQILATEAATKQVEQERHEQFKDENIEKEWFTKSKSLETLINELSRRDSRNVATPTTNGATVGTEAEAEAEADKKYILSGTASADPDGPLILDQPHVKKPTHENLKTPSREVLFFLNEITGRNFQDVDANLDLIKQRLKEAKIKFGNLETACLLARRICIDRKQRWQDDDRMREFLRPATLFAKKNFWNYAGVLSNKLQIKPPEQQEIVNA